jgi:hypothetical protein
VRIAATNSLYFKKKPVNDIIINILAMKYGGGEKNPSKNKYLLPLLVGKGKRLEITTNLSMIKLQGEKNYPSLVGMCTYCTRIFKRKQPAMRNTIFKDQARV